MKRVVLGLLLLLGAAFPATAQLFVQVDTDSVLICPAGDKEPTFEEPSCQPIVDNRIDTQHRHIWLRAKLNVPEQMLTSDLPLAVFVSAKAASRVFLNGILIGENGTPGPTAEAEMQGLMDVNFYVDRDLLKAQDNMLVLELSGHHSIIELSYPFHVLGLGYFTDPNAFIMRGYIKSLLPFGILIGGALYFGLLAIRRREGLTSILVPLIAFFAAAQLITEVSRGLIAYPYPFQDIRLIMILVFAAACGFCLLLHVIDQFVSKQKAIVTFAAATLVAIAVEMTPGFDGKAVMSLQLPALLGAGLAGIKAARGQKSAIAYTIVLILFALLTIPAGFLDTYYYYSVAGLLLFLFGVEIRKNNEERRLRALEQARADRLQIALDESKEAAAPSQIKVTSQGKMELISTDQISVCRGARDYVELEVEGRGTILHDSSLSQLEQELPSTFLRVHRSYIVNTRYIRTLERAGAGSGKLLLGTNLEVPVSRRILPKVRKALA